jgi:L-threonylcarbamoyladenylate synthase
VRTVDGSADDALDAVVAAWNRGAVVALPTDTVYGLGAPLARPDAVAALFDVKGRPAGLALPVLVEAEGQAGDVVTAWPAAASALAARWWPGPLTLVVPATPLVGSQVGGDGTTVGVRCPDHPLVRALCAAAGPLAVTSANRHGEPPCRTAAEVTSVIDSPLVALVADGGTCDGVPSTVVDCTSVPARCLRAGGVPWSDIEREWEGGAIGP